MTAVASHVVRMFRTNALTHPVIAGITVIIPGRTIAVVGATECGTMLDRPGRFASKDEWRDYALDLAEAYFEEKQARKDWANAFAELEDAFRRLIPNLFVAERTIARIRRVYLNESEAE